MSITSKLGGWERWRVMRTGKYSMETSGRDAIVKRVKDAAILIAEHVDTVQIFVTFHAEDGETTCSYEYGQGNFYARQGQVDEWLTIQREYQKLEAQRRDEGRS